MIYNEYTSSVMNKVPATDLFKLRESRILELAQMQIKKNNGLNINSTSDEILD